MIYQKLFDKHINYKELSLQKRRFKHSDIVGLIHALPFERQIVGLSFEQREIYKIKVGQGKRKILLWSQMHGNEATATMAIFDILNFLKPQDDDFQDFRNEILNKLELHFVPMINPDGAERFIRRNAQGIDMNRDALALQCPESKILKSLVIDLEPEFSFNLHDQNIRYSAGISSEQATIPNSLPARVGLPLEGTEVISVESPFDYEKNSRLYCSPDFPDRNSPNFTAFVHDELETLIRAAGGRTLALFTSNKALNQATEEMRLRLPYPILSPSDYPRQRLIQMFLEDENSCIFASQSFFQGVDLPGRTLSLVVLDKLPFPRPDDPLLEARREAVGKDVAFGQIDLPIAATSLAQAAGRLIRTANDKGVVAVLDRRLAVAGYWRTLIGALPPMTRTRNREEIEKFLQDITDDRQD